MKRQTSPIVLPPLLSQVTIDRLKEVLKYDPRTGLFTHLKNCKQVKAGDIAGCNNGRGYIRIGVDGVAYMAHRLAWLYMTGKWPSQWIDHRDQNKKNNRWKNLRDVSRTANLQNTKYARGVHMQDGRYRAQIRANGRTYFLGGFSSFTEASAAYQKAKRELHEAA